MNGFYGGDVVMEKQIKRALKSEDTLKINKAFENIFNTYKGLVCFILAKYISKQEEIDDLLQDTFLDYFRHAHSVLNIKSYLSTTAKNKALTHLKMNQRHISIPIEDIDLYKSNIASTNEYYIVMNQLEKSLSELEYNVLCLHLLEDKTFKYIAGLLKEKESTIKTIYYRTIQKSKQILEGRQ